MAPLFPAVLCLLLAAFVEGQVVSVEPREAVVVSGGNVSMVCRVNYALTGCRVKIGSNSHNLFPETAGSSAAIQYKGLGFDRGECGVLVRSVDESMNGEVTCIIPQAYPETLELTGTMQLVIARAPAEPVLRTSEGSQGRNSYKEDDTMQALCEVAHGRPPARITWFLNEEQVLEGLHEPNVTREQDSNLTTISQVLTRRLRADDNAKVLACKAEHAALQSPRIAKTTLDVQYPPKGLEEGQITIFGLKLQERGQLNVSVRANPPPSVEWSVGEEKLAPGHVDQSGLIEVPSPVAWGGGYYNVTLVFQQLKREDVERVYYLRVTNPLDYKDFTVRISTLAEPDGVELGTGGIVGIVVALLVLLLAVSLLVFAKATHRWCFGDGSTEETRPRSSGESDTESAVAGARTERSRLSGLSRALPALRDVLRPRARSDKVAQVDEAARPQDEEKPLQESEKKNIVYAELTLSDMPAPKPTPETTEYAEIVYGQPPPAVPAQKKE